MSQSDFAIVAEGVTDQIILKHILVGFFGDWDEEPTINFVQPLYDTTGQKGAPSPGGFDQVIKYLESSRYREALQFNRYLVIHLDTDVSEQYGVQKRDGERERTIEELFDAVTGRLRRLIDESTLVSHGHRFLFAIAVHSSECWLLPLCFSGNQEAKQRKVAGCLAAANHALRKSNRSPLSAGEGRNEHKDPVAYLALARHYSKQKTLLEHRRSNPSLSIFLDTLQQRNIQLAAMQPSPTPEGAILSNVIPLTEHVTNVDRD